MTSTERAERFLAANWGSAPAKRRASTIEPEFRVVVALVEPRPHPMMAPVLRNVVEGIERDPRIEAIPWVITSQHTMDFVHAQFELSEGVVAIPLELPDANLTINQYNLLLRNTAFWEIFPHENVLIVQTDGFVQTPERSLIDFLRLDVSMIGGLYNFIALDVNGRMGRVCTEYKDITKQLHASPALPCGINGGISLRKKSHMIECIRNVTIEDIVRHRESCGMNALAIVEVLGEDVFFQNALDVLRKPLPRVPDCMRFANNVMYPEFLDPSDLPPMFVHGFQKTFFRHGQGRHAARWELDQPQGGTNAHVGR